MLMTNNEGRPEQFETSVNKKRRHIWHLFQIYSDRNCSFFTAIELKPAAAANAIPSVINVEIILYSLLLFVVTNIIPHLTTLKQICEFFD